MQSDVLLVSHGIVDYSNEEKNPGQIRNVQIYHIYGKVSRYLKNNELSLTHH
ncbi:MAG: hypothetical protein OWQ47_05210 [Acidianus infernus]|nr:hypothetical protein [Acidianus infernus]